MVVPLLERHDTHAHPVHLNLIIGAIGVVQSFDAQYIMTGGGPVNSTLVPVLYLFNTAFTHFKMGYASAIAWMLFVVIMVLTIAQLKLAKRWCITKGRKNKMGAAKNLKQVKARNRSIRMFSTHTTLLIGAIIFLIPFVWLITTSFKDETQIFKFPPELIPTKQVQVTIDGKQCGLSTMVIDGKTVRVAETAELEDGTKRVRVLPPQPFGGKDLTVSVDKLTQVRKHGLHLENYTDALDFLPKGTHKGLLYLWNTLVISLMSVLGTVLSSSMVAYSFYGLRWPGRDIVFGVLLADDDD